MVWPPGDVTIVTQRRIWWLLGHASCSGALCLISHSPLHFSLLVVTTLTTVYHHLLQPQCLFNSTAFVFMMFLIDKAKSLMQ